MRTTYVKLAIGIAMLGMLGYLSLLALRGTAELLAYFQAGADPASALNIVPNVPVDLNVAMIWQPDDQDTGRVMEPFTRAQIEAAYARAWLQLNISYGRGEPYGLKTYFVGPALQDASEQVVSTAQAGLQIEQANMSHDLQLHFYAADGSIISFTDSRAVIVQFIRDSSGKVIYAGEQIARYDVVMFLEDGTWRVRHWVRSESDAAAASTQARGGPGLIESNGRTLLLDGQPYTVAGINYYPAENPWDTFWTTYDPEIVDADLQRIQELGLNTIRVFIPFQQFGEASVEPKMLDKLDTLLNQAEQHQLKVIVTLFDFRGDYQLLLWPVADRHMAKVLTRFAQHPAILAWDIKNEPDLDYDTAGKANVDAWLEHAINTARRYDPYHLITIGWSSPTAAATLANQLDLVSFHFFGRANTYADQYGALRAAVPGRPLLLSEFGLPTWNSFFFPNGHSEHEQAAYYAELLTATRQTDGIGTLNWTLYDFTKVPSSVAGMFPWQKGPQSAMGIYHADGTPKPAAALVSPGAALDVAPFTVWERLFKPFWVTLLGFALFVTMLADRSIRWWKAATTRAPIDWEQGILRILRWVGRILGWVFRNIWRVIKFLFWVWQKTLGRVVGWAWRFTIRTLRALWRFATRAFAWLRRLPADSATHWASVRNRLQELVRRRTLPQLRVWKPGRMAVLQKLRRAWAAFRNLLERAVRRIWRK